MAPKIYRLSSSGAWEQLKKLYRLSSSGTWQALKKVWRLSSSGVWEIIFSALATPSVKSATKPLLYFRDTGGYETASSEIAAATGSNLTSPAAYDGDKIFLIRGNWNEEPISFYMRIQKSQTAGFTSGVSTVNGSSSVTRTYATYSDSNYADEVPLSSANRYTITKADVRDGYYFRGYIEATNDTNLMGSYSTEVVLPRMYANVSFNIQNAGPPVSYVSNPQSNGGTFTWSYSGNSTIQAQDIDQQEFLVYPLNNTSGSALYSTTISPGTGTSTPTTTVTFTSANLDPNTQYTIVIKATMKDGWSSNSNVALRTIETDQKTFTTSAAKPATPINVTGTDVGTNRAYNNGAVNLSWTQPSNGVTVTGYKIEYATGPAYLTYSTLTANTGNNNTSGTFTGLLSNTNYKFRVIAIGSTQDSDPSADSDAVLITTVPLAPTGVFAVAGDASADVSFNLVSSSNNGGKSISFYRATSSPGSITSTENISPITVTGLTNYTPYTFTVAAYNANGYSAESTASSAVTPQLPLPIGSGTVTIASQSQTNYIYEITSYGTWSNSATTYDYQWQTSSNGGISWTTRASGTNVSTIPNYNASSYKAQNIRLMVYGRNQTGAAVTPLDSNTLFIFYTAPVITSFSVTGDELQVSYSFSYTADDPSTSAELEYKLSSASTWTTIVGPASSGFINLSPGTYDFRLWVYNSVNGGSRLTSSTLTGIVVSKFYVFSFGNILYPSTNGHIGLTGGSTTNIPSTGKFLSIFPGDYVGNTGASPGYMLAWSDSTKYVIRFDGYLYGFVGQSAYRVQWMATFYTNQDYVDVKIISKGSSISGAETVGLYKNGFVVSGLPGPYTLLTGTTFRIRLDATSGSFGISYDEISITSPNDIMTTAGTKTGTGDDDVFYSITTSANYYKTPVVTFQSPSNTNTTISVPFTETSTDYITYNVRSGSYSGTVLSSGTLFSSPLTASGLTAATTYYITATPYNYKNQVGPVVQTTSQTTPPAPTVTWSNVTSSTATVSWSAASATSYYVMIYNINSLVYVYGPTTTSNTSVNLTGLTTAAPYKAYVQGINSGGTGPDTQVDQYTDAKLFYDGNTNTGGSAPATTEHDYNSFATVAGNTGSLTKTYGTWDGWSLFANGSGTTYGPGYTSTIQMDGSKFLYAKWTPNVPGTPSATVNYGPSITTSSGNYLTFSNVFFGSDTSSVLVEWGTSTSYGNSSTITSNGGSYTTPSNLSWNTTYYWRVRGYNPFYNNYGSAQTGSVSIPITQWTVTFNAGDNGGTVDGVSSTTRTVNNGSAVNPVPSASRSGYTFNGWYNSSSGGSLIASGGGSYTPTSSTTLWAQFTLIQVAPFGGSVTVSKQSGNGTISSARVGDVYAVTSATASGTPTPSVSSYQWQKYNPFSGTWSSVPSGASGSTYTINFLDGVSARYRCLVTFSNGVSPNLQTGSNEIQVASPTVTNVISYYYSTAPFVIWYVFGYNMQAITSRTIIQGTTQSGSTTSLGTNNDAINAGISRQTSVGGTGQTYALIIRPESNSGGGGNLGTTVTTNTLTNNLTNRNNSPITNTFSPGGSI